MSNPAAAPKPYWQATELAAAVRQRFEKAHAANDDEAMRGSFFLLTHYYGRTRVLMRQAFEQGRQPLAVATLRNLLVLDAALGAMHRLAPHVVPLAMPLTEALRERYVLGLMVRVFEDSPEALAVPELVERLEAFRLLGDIDQNRIARLLDTLDQSGMIQQTDTGWRRTDRLFLDLTMAAAVLETLVGPRLYAGLSAKGFRRLHQITERPEAFIPVFCAASGMDATTGALLVQVARALQAVHRLTHTHWRHRDLLHSDTPRPYQLEAYAVFRAFGYQGAVIEAPTGSGKTLMGMLCIQDWLQSLVPGQCIVVLVPTNNYQQQWIGELCYHPVGLCLSPDVVFAGTPAELERHVRRTGDVPAVAVLTYAGLTSLSRGQGAFDAAAIDRFLKTYDVHQIVLDEVHKAADDPQSPTAEAVRHLAAGLAHGRPSGVIGFSGTAHAYRERLEEVGLRLVHAVPLIELIAAGFVAPFGELGLPFAYSERERRVRALLEEYKRLLERFIGLVGVERLVRDYAAVPLDERVRIARRFLGMYGSRSDAEAAARTRLQAWEKLTRIGLVEAPLITILQVASGQSDADLAGKTADLAPLLAEAERIRAALKEHLFLPDTVAMLNAPDFGKRLDRKALAALDGASRSPRRQAEIVLASTLVGLYDGLKNWYQHMGEGRVAAVRAVCAAERRTRHISGTIVFDRGRRIRWEEGIAAPGFDGVAGLFAETLGDPAIHPLAALSSELYMPRGTGRDLPPYIAEFIERKLMRDDLGTAMADLLLADLEVGEGASKRFHNAFYQQLELCADRLRQDSAAPFRTFVGEVIRPIRRAFGHKRVGLPSAMAARLRRRLNLRNDNLRSLLVVFLDYAALARRWRQAIPAELVQASGRQQPFYVVRMPSSGRRKQLMYDLVSRIVDDPKVPIDMAIVSNWARTGWNVRRPNLLIDATATRDVTAWQQLRGRAMRALPTWTNDCYRAQRLLLGADRLKADDGLPDEARATLDELLAARPVQTDSPAVRQILNDLLGKAASRLKDLSLTRRLDAAVALMQRHNKVTHIYELLKATGSPAQIERDGEGWKRRDSIAEKHRYETSVNPLDGRLSAGDAHAPLVYAQDPRLDAPTALQRHLSGLLDGCDRRLVLGWLDAAGKARVADAD